MSEFANVTVIQKANVYFGGNVNSRTLRFADGSIKTLGFMLPGEYTFNTGDREIMDIIDGELDVLLPESVRPESVRPESVRPESVRPESAGWRTVRAGESFEAPAGSRFAVRVKTPTDYCCSFIP